jgi:threonine/homoserine/homoserine lactone efflux protein
VSIADVAGAAVLGVVLGVVTGMPIGVVNVAIVEAATRGERRFAIQIGLGGALADAVHSAIGFVGVGHIVTAHPQWSRAMAIVAGCVVVGYALLALRQHQVAEPRRRRYGVLTGLLLTLPNPAALGAWIAVAAAVWPAIHVVPALVLAACVGAGSALWFALLARWVAALPADHRVVRWLPRIAIVLLVAIAGFGLGRAL